MSKMHYFIVRPSGNSAFLELSYIKDTVTSEEVLLGHYPYVSYIKRAVEKYFIYKYKKDKFDQYTILWPKSISYVTKDVEV